MKVQDVSIFFILHKRRYWRLVKVFLGLLESPKVQDVYLTLVWSQHKIYGVLRYVRWQKELIENKWHFVFYQEMIELGLTLYFSIGIILNICEFLEDKIYKMSDESLKYLYDFFGVNTFSSSFSLFTVFLKNSLKSASSIFMNFSPHIGWFMLKNSVLFIGLWVSTFSDEIYNLFKINVWFNKIYLWCKEKWVGYEIIHIWFNEIYIRLNGICLSHWNIFLNNSNINIT